MNNPVVTAQFRNDTISAFRTAFLYYDRGQIVRHYLENSPYYILRLSKIAHEHWHDHNKLITFNQWDYAPSQFINLREYEEISATDAELITAELEYKYMRNKDRVLFL